ncbi:homeobox-leucine zipper protein HDG2-like isoform X1 [Nicotiana tomentosiformis]|uniref:homeobox-leucine zipper protein HDG2-like isoform X1 n=1 Tax=Nicotiana tomentosiformis TaxID=4098 RepID=UPI00051AD2C9|nr:homeobox-leucine zipper protein HDG2-like isoform X1 [Nicotiana tomentosiformis]XP_009629761.1 homeobox-leucine zipper protein HDG2-like isoform X1 [Nicotiana tomentosiformis]
MIPANQFSSMIGNDENDVGFVSSSSGLPLGQQSGNIMDMASNTSESELMPLLTEEEFDSKSGSDNQEGKSSDEQDANQSERRKRYHRHTQHQIQEMENFFKNCPHPDDKQRKELSRELGLEPLQVKFWFQNKRTQMKNQNERSELSSLRDENEKLRTEHVQIREALNNATSCPSCPICGGPQISLGEMSFEENQLRIENARLKEEVDRISAFAAKHLGKPVSSLNVYSSPVTPPSSLDLGNAFGNNGEVLRSSFNGPTEAEKPFIIELAVAAMEEFIQMAQMGEPLWLPSIDRRTNFLNEEEYVRLFPLGIGPKLEGFKTEASKDTAVVFMNHIKLVEILMDANKWSSMFSSIVSTAVTVDVLSTGVAGNFNGALQVIFAEFQVPFPQVPTRDCYFVRYCKRSVDGIWAVVDVSLDYLRATPTARCRRRPSGCLIQEMPNGYSKVTWIEHVEADDTAIYSIYKPLLNSGLAFGAKRWIATLDRQCERLASAMATNLPDDNTTNMILGGPEGRRSVLKLAERMVISYCSGVSATAAHQWTTLSGSGSENDVRIMFRKSINDPGRPPGIVMCAATSFWLPISPKTAFDFLRDENTRSEWDILSNGGVIQRLVHIANGRETGNSVSILRVNSSANLRQNNMLILQESSTDPTGSFVVYAPVDVPAMNTVINGGDPDYVALLPSGFAILPDGPPGRIAGGSLLTIAFQILVDSVPTAKLSLGSVATVNKLIACTVDKIRAALLSDTP